MLVLAEVDGEGESFSHGFPTGRATCDAAESVTDDPRT